MAKKHQQRPDSLETLADCANLALFEWENEVDKKLWSGREVYVAVRTANLAGRLKPTKGSHADRTEPEQHGSGLSGQ